jgi:hypothetical protein
MKATASLAHDVGIRTACSALTVSRTFAFLPICSKPVVGITLRFTNLACTGKAFVILEVTIVSKTKPL